jgi:hypothetical protein
MHNPRVLFSFLIVLIFSNAGWCQNSGLYLRNVNISTPDSVIKTTALYDTEKIKPRPEYDYYWYNTGQINHNKGGFTGKPLHGKYEVFDKNQRLMVSGSFENGVMTGSWIRWYNNGNIQTSAFYKNGMLHGEMKTFKPDGKPVLAINYKNGLLHGKLYYFKTDTTIVIEYKKGNEIVKGNKSVKKKETKGNSGQQAKVSTSSQNSQSIEKEPKKQWWKLSFLKRGGKSKSDQQVDDSTFREQKTKDKTE